MPSANSPTLNKHVRRRNGFEFFAWRRTRPSSRVCAHGHGRRPFHRPSSFQQQPRRNPKKQRCDFLYGLSRLQASFDLHLLLLGRRHHFFARSSPSFPPIYPQHIHVWRSGIVYGRRNSRFHRCGNHVCPHHLLQRPRLINPNTRTSASRIPAYTFEETSRNPHTALSFAPLRFY